MEGGRGGEGWEMGVGGGSGDIGGELGSRGQGPWVGQRLVGK